MARWKREIYTFNPNESHALERLIAYKRGRRAKAFRRALNHRRKGKMA